jgi:hypothetical protein
MVATGISPPEGVDIARARSHVINYDVSTASRRS